MLVGSVSLILYLLLMVQSVHINGYDSDDMLARLASYKKTFSKC